MKEMQKQTKGDLEIDIKRNVEVNKERNAE